MTRTSTCLAFALALTLVLAPSVFAQSSDDDSLLKPAEPDFTLVSLPTGLRLPLYGSAIRITHRFAQNFNHTDFSEFASDLFGFDSGAVIGLEYRIGLAPNVQAGLHHSSDNRTWAFFGQLGLVRQNEASPVDLSALVSLDIPRVPTGAGFEREVAPGFAAIVSHAFGEKGAVYAEPIFVHNVFNEFGTAADSDNAFLVGFGARVRIGQTVSLVAEAAPRVSGFKANTNHAAFALEKRVGGHVFQLNASNSFGTTLSQLAMGGGPANNWHLGFNISRKFF